ncbi:MAG TPA: DinB family protein, partial [Pirellulales bacterium]
MNACKLAEIPLLMTRDMLKQMLGDLSEAELLERPVDGANHIAWQIGHLIVAEHRLGSQVPGAQYPELPAGFAEQHDRQPTAQQATTGFGTTTQYLALFERTREATLTALRRLTDADLDAPAKGPANVTNAGGVLMLIANHTMLHGGQFSVVRRKLGKPVLF